MNASAPAHVAIWLLERLLPDGDRDAIVGDLIEESALRARVSTRTTAAWWCWGQVARSIPQLLWTGLRRRHWIGPLGVAVAVYVAAGAIESLGVAAISRAVGPTARFVPVLSA